MKSSSVNVHGADSDSIHKYPWKWNLTDLKDVPKNGKTVFSCFACGGGSSMGYKLAGYEVIGDLEIDPDMNKLYTMNFNPKYNYQMDIREFNKLGEYPEELKHLDILDGSPPCSVFSIAGGREKGWGKEKVFREGQSKQRLDDLFFHFIKSAEILQPKVVVAENVEGLIKGNAKGYVNEILKAFKEAGYKVQLFLLDAQTMGVPQRRKRTFFIAHREDLDYSKLVLDFQEKPIIFGEVRTASGIPHSGKEQRWLIEHRQKGDKCFADITLRLLNKNSGYARLITADDEVAHTNIANGSMTRFYDGEKYSERDFVNTQTFPQDYNFNKQNVQYVTGMSVPPVMMANVSDQIYKQWLEGDNV